MVQNNLFYLFLGILLLMGCTEDEGVPCNPPSPDAFYFQLVNTDGEDLMFGQDTIYYFNDLELYHFAGNSRKDIVLETLRFGEDRIVTGNIFPTAAEPNKQFFLQLNETDTDTFSVETFDINLADCEAYNWLNVTYNDVLYDKAFIVRFVKD